MPVEPRKWKMPKKSGKVGVQEKAPRQCESVWHSGSQYISLVEKLQRQRSCKQENMQLPPSGEAEIVRPETSYGNPG